MGRHPNPLTPQMLKDALTIIEGRRETLEKYTVMVGGETPEDPEEGAEKVRPYVGSGADWWIEDVSGLRGNVEENLRRVRAGPPAG